MKSNVQTIGQDQARPEQKAEQLLHLLQLPREDLPDQADIEAMTWEATTPANPHWILARIAALLLPYYEKDTPQAIREMEAEDWLVALEGLPQWAIERAVRWWKGPDNPDRRKRPMEGDIARRARQDTQDVKAVAFLAERKRTATVFHLPPPPPPRMTAERAAEIMAQVGFRPRRFDEAPE